MTQCKISQYSKYTIVQDTINDSPMNDSVGPFGCPSGARLYGMVHGIMAPHCDKVVSHCQLKREAAVLCRATVIMPGA